MFVCPFVTFFVIQNQEWLIEKYGMDKVNALAALGAVGATQLVIFIIIIIKYWEDFLIVVRGQGHLPYDESRKKESEYF